MHFRQIKTDHITSETERVRINLLALFTILATDSIRSRKTRENQNVRTIQSLYLNRCLTKVTAILILAYCSHLHCEGMAPF